MFDIKWFWRGELRVLAADLTEEQADMVLLDGVRLFPGKRLLKERQQ